MFVQTTASAAGIQEKNGVLPQKSVSSLQQWNHFVTNYWYIGKQQQQHYYIVEEKSGGFLSPVH